MQCKKIKTNRNQCKGNAMLNGQFCYFHNPAIPEDQKQQNRASGGRQNAIAIAEPLTPIPLQNTADVVSLLASTINEVRAGRMEVRMANCLGVLSGHLIKAFEISDLEKRLEGLELKVETK